jgi:hypothetical protein
MYYKEIESSRDKKEAHNNANKRTAGDRALARQEYNRKIKKEQK